MKNYAFANILFSKTRQSVLALLYLHPEKKFYTNEIIRYAQCGTGAVQRELQKLCEAGLIMVEKIGNQKQYRANQSSPLFIDLQNIIIKTFGVGDVLREALFSVKNEIKIAFVYGSIASNEIKTKSDIDLMIISDALSYADIFPLLISPEEKLGRPINPTFYSQKEWSSKRNSENNFVQSVIARPKIFLIGDLDDLNKL